MLEQIIQIQKYQQQVRNTMKEYISENAQNHFETLLFFYKEAIIQEYLLKELNSKLPLLSLQESQK